MAAVPLNPGVIDTDMLRQCWADGAAVLSEGRRVGRAAAPFILGLGPKDNGGRVERRSRFEVAAGAKASARAARPRPRSRCREARTRRA